MTSVRKFLFDESFDVDHPRAAPDPYLAAPEPEPEPEPAEPPPPVFSEAEVEAARRAGYAEGEKAGSSVGYGKGFAEGHAAGRKDGLEAGRAEMAKTNEARTAAALERIAAGVDQLLAERHATNAMRQDQPVHIALAIVRKLMPELARRGGLAEIEALVRGCVMELIDEPRLVVRVADDAREAVSGTLDAMAGRGFGAKLMVVGEPSLAAGDCRIEWAEGGVERDTARLLADIEHCAARLLSAPAT
ncbi:FliH/SctL family protein [Azospirillum sp. A39]|uniref:FliH/SctL family protein n=1 Tax=Azospirillum sp. A39 TaxID=3462279 RepID=UPI004045C686